MTSLPEWNDPQYQTKINDWLDKNAHLMSRQDSVGKQLQMAYGLVDGRVKATSDFQNKLGQVQEFNTLQKGGYIASPANADAQVFGGTAEPTLVHGRIAKNLDQLQQLIADPRTPQAQKDQLTNLYNYGKGFLASDTGASDVMTNKAHELFSTNGNFNATAQGIVNGVGAMLGKETKPVEYEATIPIPGLPNIKPGEAPTMKIKGTPEQVQGALTPYEQEQKQAGTLKAINQAGVQNTPENLADLAAKQRGEISEDELFRRVRQRALQAVPAPAPTPSPTPAGQRPLSMAEPGRTPTSNNDYRFPEGATDHAGINRNVWANVMSEEGREFGKDGSHDSVFGLWADSPGIEGDAYRAVKQYGPDSLEAYQAVTNAWTNKFLHQSQPWNLNSPGLQQMVISDSQHRGGQEAADILNQMAGIPLNPKKPIPVDPKAIAAINAMDPAQAIREYSELRKPLWTSSQGDRLARERDWALRHNDQLAGTT